MLRQSVDHPCTAVYARLDFTRRGASLTVSIGGHPKPLILRTDGHVEAIGKPALPLGVAWELELTDHRTELAPGDALVLYTDGLTDAYAPGRILSQADIVAALRSSAGESAAEILEAARRVAVPPQDGREPRDDILLLVLRLDPDVRPLVAT
jgi:serine phosphatase RsbU (regulator of sigma subunit)